jgi:hypothetical protein
MRPIPPTFVRTLLPSFLLSLLATGLEAAPVSEREALRAAAGWAQLRLNGAEPQTLRPVGDGELLWVQYAPEGWALLAGDDAARPVLGWSRTGWLPARQPDALQEWTAMLAAQIRELGAAPMAAAHADWALLAEASRGGVAPMRTGETVPPMLSAAWNQGSGWNADCPEDPAGPDGRCYTGCVATALAQVLHFWNWPESGTGLVSYTQADYGSISVDFAQASYDFAAMEDLVATPAAAELLFHAAVAVRTSFGPSGSTASTSNIPGALRNNFRYTNQAAQVWRHSNSDEAWLSLLRGELEEGRPVIYRGSGSGGHAFCLDGVDADDWFHINWGWAGTYDGWFSLDDLTPGNRNYTNMQGAVVGIHPNEEWSAPNAAPIAADVAIEILEDTMLSLSLEAFDPDGDPLDYEVEGLSAPHGEWSWTPSQDWNGEASFSWRAHDGRVWSEPALILVTVLPVNDAPTIAALQVETDEDQPISVVFEGQDVDGDDLGYLVDGQPVLNGVWHHTPPQDFHGMLQFSLQAYDGQLYSEPATLTLVVHPVNDAPTIAALQLETNEDQPLSVAFEGQDVDGDELGYLVDGVPVPYGIWQYTPPQDYHGTLQFSLQAYDGQLFSQPATLTLVVHPVNDAPVAENLRVQANGDSLVTIKLSASDVDDDSLRYFYQGVELPGNLLTLPAPGRLGESCVYEYQAFDGELFSGPARIEVLFKLTILPEVQDPELPEPKPSGPELADVAEDGLDPAEAEALLALLPGRPTLQPNYPNPFNPTTTLVVALPAASPARLSVHNLTGALVAVLHDGPLSAGEHRLVWDAGTLASGLYIAVLETPEGRDVRRMSLVR